MTLTPEKIPVSVLIPAKDEELNLPACLECVSRAAEIFVVDSNSSDRSIEISQERGAKVIQFDFEAEKVRFAQEEHKYNLEQQKNPNTSLPKPKLRKKKNWSLDTLPFSYEWVLIVDCDERITEDLWNEIQEVVKNDSYDGYYLNRKVYFLGKWIRYGGKYPDWNLRLFKHKKGRYEDLGIGYIPNTGDNEVHEHVILRDERGNNITQDRAGYLKNDMDHIDFRDIYQWLARHNRYSNWEAGLYDKLLKGELKDGIQPNLFGKGPERTRFLRGVWVWLPFKPLLRFILFYFLRLGFLNGGAGYIYARLLSQYEYQIGVKLYELRTFGGKLNVRD